MIRKYMAPFFPKQKTKEHAWTHFLPLKQYNPHHFRSLGFKLIKKFAESDLAKS